MKNSGLILVFALTFLPFHSFGQAEKVLTDKEVTEAGLVDALQPERTFRTRQIRIAPEQGTRPTPPPPPKQASASLLLTFETNSTELTAQARKMLDTLGSAMRSEKLAPHKFVVEGHADPRGGEQANLILSEKRAEKVVTYLSENQQIERSRLRAVGKGQSEPLNAANPFAPENRRVTIKTLDE